MAQAVGRRVPPGVSMKIWALVAVVLCSLRPAFTDVKNTTTVIQPSEISILPPVQITARGLEVQPGGTQGPDTDPTGAHPPGTHQPDVHSSGANPSAALGSKETLAEPMKIAAEPLLQSGGEEQPAEGCAGARSLAMAQLLGKAISDFGMEMFKKVLKETKKPNVIISPLSIVLGLAQLALGSANKTERELVKALHFDPLNCSHHTLHTAVNTFNQRVLSIASTIYVREGFHLKSGFLTDSERFYKSRPQPLSGVAAVDANKINAWVEQMTGGKIKTFLTEVPGNLELMLVNAINFKGLWKVQFDPLATGPEPFFLEDGHMERVPTMKHPKYPVSSMYSDELQSEVIRMAFKHNISFIVVKPVMNSGLNTIVKNVNISDIVGHFKPRPMLVRLPKLNIDFNTDLKGTLQKLGLGDIFRNPDLSRISDRPLVVSSVQHKATMELREEGVEAAASTAIAINRSLLQCNINRPFFFLIRDDISGIPLFLGTIKDPQPEMQKEPDLYLEGQYLDVKELPVPK
ncbi:serpin peptidase inhibitor, clade F (alpha-2 antiplasmin, pigment epithelium derived factor), member 2b [Pristis pectinata]|uniref:serpin peptidase inhibitor, clade F (alpha-2 antiplasmin, pigment epithelium derived factor), member 2b n=1 Tax=Pristis pectinata TaxID=685728 RepID=UPI00223E7990|nr:serpin peptidase inhibitor, clade F (alpha-2 antiplasmin, pigment epithelium derived factor), member 2b [Pristis pectinata]